MGLLRLVSEICIKNLFDIRDFLHDNRTGFRENRQQTKQVFPVIESKKYIYSKNICERPCC